MPKLRLLTACALSAFALAGAGLLRGHQTTEAVPTVKSPAKLVDCSTTTAQSQYTRGHWAWVLDAVPNAKPGTYEEMSRVISRSMWDAMTPQHRRMLRQRVLAARGGVPFYTTCFAPGTDITTVKAFRAAENAISNFRVSNRWTSTSTNGTVNQGGPMTLTWNLVTDGTSIAPIETGASATSSNLRAYSVTAYGSEANFRAQLRLVFARYEELTGIRYVEVSYDDGAALPDSGGVLNTRADIRIAGCAIDGDGGILAYNYFPNYSDMVLDTSDVYLTNTTSVQNPNPLLLLRNTVSHEHGHGLGLDHVCPVNETKLMEPYVSFEFEGPQLDDIQADQYYYGDKNEYPAVNNTTGAATNLGTLATGTKTVDTVSIGYSSDTDFFKFNTDATNRKLVATVTVPFSSYLEGAQNSDGSCTAGTTFNPANKRNLGLRILNSSGTVLKEVNANAAGSSESLTIDSLTGTGAFYAQVYSSDSLDVPQMYVLTLNLSAGAVTGSTVSGRCVSIYANSSFNGSERTGLSGATVTIKNTGGTTVATGDVNGDGYFNIANVPNGNYNVTATYLRDGTSLITLDPPTRAITVSSADVSVPRFATYSIFGIVKAPDKQGTIVPVSGITVQLVNPAGTVIGTKVTSADGRYQFKLQRAATFTVKAINTTALTFPSKSVTLPGSGSDWSPCVRYHIVGTRNATALAPSGKVF